MKIREGWEKKKLGEVCKVLTDGDWIESKDQSSEGIRLIQTGNIGVGIFENKGKNARFISFETFNRLNCTEIFEDDCLVSRLPDPLGRACIIPDLGHRMITAVDCSIIRFKNLLLNKFFIYYSQSSVYQKNIDRYATGTTRKRISRSNLSKIPIPIPPLPIQNNIVAELDALNDIINIKKQQLEELDKLAEATFYDMFGDPVENEKGWEVRKLGDISIRDGEYGGGFSAIKFEEAKPRYIRITDINEKGELNHQKVSPSGSGHKRYKLNEGDLLFARSGATVGKTYVHNEKNGYCIFAGYLIRFILDSSIINSKFAFYYTKTLFYNSWINSQIRAVAQPNINAKQYSNLPIYTPPISLQTQFAEKIEHIENQKSLIQGSIDDVQQLLDYTMDKYFS